MFIACDNDNQATQSLYKQLTEDSKPPLDRHAEIPNRGWKQNISQAKVLLLLLLVLDV